MENVAREIRRYVAPNGKVPFDEWFDALRDLKAKAIVLKRINRIEIGNLGDCCSVGAGVYEFRINYGSGYRLYFGQVGTTVVLLLCGGDKSSQERDIQKAQEYWADYEERESSGE